MRLTKQKKVTFDVQKENEVFLETQHEFVDENQAPTSTVVPNEGLILEIPQRFEHLFQKKLTRNISKLK